MELIGEKIIRLQDSGLKVEISGSNETSIFLNRDLEVNLNLQDAVSINFIIDKNDIYKLFCFAFSFKL
jgi:hypothetical protein